MSEGKNKSERKEPLDHLRSRKKPVKKTVYISTDTEVAERFSELQVEERTARLLREQKPHSESAKDDHTKAKAAREAFEPEMRENSIKFVFESIGRKKVDALIKANPITDEQKEEAKAINNGEDPGIEWNPETFPDELIAACLVEPELSRSEMLEWLSSDDWNNAEQQSLFQAAWEACSTRNVVHLGKD